MGEHESVVYYIGARSVRRIKIGVTTNLRKRLRRLRSQAIDELHVLATEPGTHVDEAKRHVLFDHLRQHGEWFSWEDELDLWVRLIQSHEYARSRGFGPLTPDKALKDAVSVMTLAQPLYERALDDVERRIRTHG